MKHYKYILVIVEEYLHVCNVHNLKFTQVLEINENVKLLRGQLIELASNQLNVFTIRQNIKYEFV